jgi:hypothetical protein
MLPSRGIAIRPSKMPKAKTITRKDDPNKVEMFSGGGLYANIAAKKKRIAAGSGEKMRKAGASSDFANAASFKEGAQLSNSLSPRKVTLIPRSWVVAALTNLGKVLEEYRTF